MHLSHFTAPVTCATKVSRARSSSVTKSPPHYRHGVHRLLHLHRIQVWLQTILCGLHQRTVEWGADWKNLRPLRTTFIGKLGSSFHGSGVSGNNNLFRRIDVGGRAHFALRDVLANGLNFFEFHSKNRRHSSNPNRDGLLHIFSAIANSAYGVGEGDRARSHVS